MGRCRKIWNSDKIDWQGLHHRLQKPNGEEIRPLLPAAWEAQMQRDQVPLQELAQNEFGECFRSNEHQQILRPKRLGSGYQLLQVWMPGWIYSQVRLAHRHHQKYLQTSWDGWGARLNQRYRSSLHTRCQSHRLRDLLLLKNLQFANWNRRCDSNVRCLKNPSPNPKKKPGWRLNEEGPWVPSKERKDLLETSGKHHELKQEKYLFEFQKLK